eukprot:scaffold1034_cov127-Cylindrotheca_fusiformis.AAC.39
MKNTRAVAEKDRVVQTNGNPMQMVATRRGRSAHMDFLGVSGAMGDLTLYLRRKLLVLLVGAGSWQQSHCLLSITFGSSAVQESKGENKKVVIKANHPFNDWFDC